MGSEAKDGNIGFVAARARDDLGFANGKQGGARFTSDACDGSAWIANGAGTGDLERGQQHVGEFILVFGSHQYNFRNVAQVADVE